MNAIVPIGVDALVPRDMDSAIRLAQAMASAKLVPRHLQGDTGTCLMIVEQAMRWRMSPFAVAQCTSAIGGKLMFEGKLVAAAVESMGVIEGGFDYKVTGEGNAMRVVVSAKRVGETNPRQITLALKDARTDNSMWTRQPEQQLCYAGTRVWARRWAPSALLGVYAPEEFNRGPVIEGSVDEPQHEEPARADDVHIDTYQPTADTPAVTKPVTPPVRPPSQQKQQRRTWADWLDDLEAELGGCEAEEEVNEIVGREQTQKATETLRNGAADRLNKMIRNAYDRITSANAPPLDSEIPL